MGMVGCSGAGGQRPPSRCPKGYMVGWGRVEWGEVGWGARVEGTGRRRKNCRLKITFTNETTCNTYKTHILKTKP